MAAAMSGSKPSGCNWTRATPAGRGGGAEGAVAGRWDRSEGGASEGGVGERGGSVGGVSEGGQRSGRWRPAGAVEASGGGDRPWEEQPGRGAAAGGA
eukprot:5741992-Prymnesium_polylepis.1